MKKLISIFTLFLFVIISFYSQNVSAQSSRLDIEEIVVTGTKAGEREGNKVPAVSDGTSHGWTHQRGTRELQVTDCLSHFMVAPCLHLCHSRDKLGAYLTSLQKLHTT